MISGGTPSFSRPSTNTVFNGKVKLGSWVDSAVCSRPTRLYLSAQGQPTANTPATHHTTHVLPQGNMTPTR
jgi:hypothetical protein